jgi:hypothetical protein
MEMDRDFPDFITKKIWEVVEGDQPNSQQEGHRSVMDPNTSITNINREIME